MSANGFMVPVNRADWLASGARSNWCATPFWTNENVFLRTAAGADVTDIRANEPVTIQVGIQGVYPPGQTGMGPLNLVEAVQAWVCYPNTSPGAAGMAGMPVGSINPADPPSWTGSQGVYGYPSSDPTWYQDPDTSDNAYVVVSLSPAWTPRQGDILPPNTSAHCCVLVNTLGLADADVQVNPVTGTPVVTGTSVGVADALTNIDICQSPYQGQRNINILPLPVIGPNALGHQFGFLAATPSSQPTRVTVEVTPVTAELDRGLARLVRAGRYRELPLRPAPHPLTALRLRANPYPCSGRLQQLIHAAEEIVEEPIDDLAHPFRQTSRLALRLPPAGVQPLLLELECSPGAPVGSVYQLDITQTEASGERGGIRLIAVVVPD